MHKIDVLKKDFKTALSCINFDDEYEPLDTAFLRALAVGLMPLAIKYAESDDDVSEELDGAEKYLRMYEETSDSAYKDMANDELRHAGILIKKHLAKASDDETREKLNALEKKRLEMQKAVSSATVPVKAE